VENYIIYTINDVLQQPGIFVKMNMIACNDPAFLTASSSLKLQCRKNRGVQKLIQRRVIKEKNTKIPLLKTKTLENY
jgi:hypothetical protein